MPFTAQELASIANSTLDFYMSEGESFAQNIKNKPMLAAFDNAAGTFPGGKGNVSLSVRAGQGGGSLMGYTHDDLVGYYNPANNKRVNFPWKEMHIGLGMTHTELKEDGITVLETDGDPKLREKDGREKVALVNLMETKMEEFAEDYAVSMDTLIHGDGTSDAKAIAGIRSFILDDPTTGSTGGLSRVGSIWWRNRAATAANAGAGGQGAITSSATGGGALLQFLQAEGRQLRKFAKNGANLRLFAGSSFIGAIESELRANGNYSMTGFRRKESTSGDMAPVTVLGKDVEYDPTLDDLGFAKRMYAIDMRNIRLWYMSGERMKKATPPRPYDRYVLYRALTTTGVLAARQLNTSGVYDIA